MAFRLFALRVILVLIALVGFALYFEAAGARRRLRFPIVQLPTERCEADEKATRWAVLMAGSKGFPNYRHQVKKRTIRSHVMEFGGTGKDMKSRKLYLFQSFDPTTQDLPSNMINSTNHMGVIDQKSTALVFLWGMYKSEKDTRKKVRWLKLIRDTIQHRTHLDTSIQIIGFLLFGPEKGPYVVKFTRDRGLPIADDLDCLKSLVRLFETYCGLLTEYGLKYVRSIANMCNAGVSRLEMEEACWVACGGHKSFN